MVAALQFIIAAVVGFVVGGIVNLAGVADPWPVVIGVLAFLACLGVSVIFVDADGDIF